MIKFTKETDDTGEKRGENTIKYVDKSNIFSLGVSG